MGKAAKATKKSSARPTKAAKACKTAPAKAPSKKMPETKPAMKSTHPATSEMVNAAIGALKDRKGSSLQAIKKYIVGNYVVDVRRLSSFIKKYLKSAVEKNIIVQTAGVGASGRFKLVKLVAEKKSKVANKVKAQPAVMMPKSPSKNKKIRKRAMKTNCKSAKPMNVYTN